MQLSDRESDNVAECCRKREVGMEAEMEESSLHSDRLYILVIYDIMDDRKRLRLAKMLQGYGIRIQKSAFEAVLDRKKYKKLLQRLPAYAKEEDSIRVYKIIGKNQVTAFGKAAVSETEDVIII